MVYGTNTKITYQNKILHTNEERYPILVQKYGIPIIAVENFPLHNMVYIEPIVTMQGNHSHGTIVIPTSFILARFVMANFHVDVPTHLTTIIPSHTIVTTTPIPLDPRRNPLNP